MPTYLVVEDDLVKRNRYTRFAQHYGLRFEYATTPLTAIKNLQPKERRDEFSGVVADFELKCRRQDNWHNRMVVAGPDGQPYTISTGLGILDWVHRIDPQMPLWSLTDVSATHAPLFMSAAALWLDAKPLAIERLYECGTQTGDRMYEELQNPRQHVRLNPHWMWIASAREALQRLLNTPYAFVEAFDWLNALTNLEPSTAGFIPALEKKIRQLTLDQSINAHAHSLAPVMARWQVYLDEIYQDFAVDRQLHRWPKIDLDRPPRALSIWEDFNPITGFLGKNSECEEFFEAEDVRLALTQWRARGEQP